MTFEGEREHLGATFQRKTEGFGELAEDVGHERDLEEVADVVLDTQGAFSLAEAEL